MRKAIFPGSFDPFTIGHYDVLESALKLFDKIYIAIGYNSTKERNGYFTLQQRMEIISAATAHLSGIEICTYPDLTIDLCKRLGVQCIIRGLRTTTDFELESVIAQANKKMYPEVVSLFIPASQEYSFISSTVVRDVLIHGGDASLFLPRGVDLSILKK